MIGLRYKMNGNSAIDPDIISFYNFGTTFSPKTKSDEFFNNYKTTSFTTSTLNFDFLEKFDEIKNIMEILFATFVQLIQDFNIISIYSLTQLPNALVNTISGNLNLSFFVELETTKEINLEVNNNIVFTTSSVNSNGNFNMYSGLEISNSLRFTRYHNPLINFSPKSGNYVGI
jgi:hypothetical protein